MNEFTKGNLTQLRDEIKDAIQAVADKHNLTIQLGRGNFTPNRYALKLEIFTQNTLGRSPAQEKREKEFITYCKLYGFSPQDLGRTVVYQGLEYKIIGLNSSAPKNPICLERDGRTYKAPAETILPLLSRSDPSNKPHST